MRVHALSNTDNAGSNLGADNFSKNKKFEFSAVLLLLRYDAELLLLKIDNN